LNLPTELQHGFIAQNIEEVFPELVTTVNLPILDDKSEEEIGEYEYKAVNYVGMISILTSSLKEMNKKVAALESELEAIKGEGISNKKSKLNGQNNVEDIGFSMKQNRPNPFTNQTTINYTLPSNTKATISIFDLSGKFIRDYNLTSEKGKVVINSSEIGKGMFLYSLISNSEVIVTKKMIIK